MRTACTKCVLASDQSSVSSWLVQPIKELSSAVGGCAGRGCALVRKLANYSIMSTHVGLAVDQGMTMAAHQRRKDLEVTLISTKEQKI